MAARRARRPTRGRLPDQPIEGLPVVAIVGRPNVGKSTLFNRIVGERLAIVEDRARTTRDRLYDVGEWNGRRFIVVDTGGLEQRPTDAIEEGVQDQARLAIEEADVIVLVVDAAAGPTPADQEASELLRSASAPVLLAANKADNPRRELEAAEFHRLGWEETYPISALHGRGTGDLLDAVVWALPPESEQELERKRRESDAEAWQQEQQAAAEGVEEAAFALDDRPARIAIVGRPNVGKSSLLNALLGEQRAIVSDIPGTTRDAIDTTLDWAGREVRLVDTAGIRRRGKVASGPAAERFATLRAMKAVTRADVAVVVLDATEGMTAQDAHLCGNVVEEGAGLVVAINKWDLLEKEPRTFDEYAAAIRRDAPFIDFAPVLAISAKSGLRVTRVLESALDIAAERRRRVPTAALNALLREVSFRHQPRQVRGRRPHIYYATQVGIEPPTFVFFASAAADIHFSYRRYLENRLREAFGFAGTPIRLIFRERSRDELERRPVRRKRGGRPARAASR